MGTASKSLKELLQLVDDADLVLPEIQRDFVWSRRNVMMLFDSLYRQLPIGHMLVWRTKRQVSTRRFAHQAKGRPRNLYGYLLDGQQRLTAISKVRDKDDNYPLFFALRPEDPDRPELGRFVWESRSVRNDPWFVEVSEVLSGGFSPLSVIERLKQADDFDLRNDDDRVRSGLSKLQHMLEVHLGVTEFDSDNYRDATELFIRFNSTGTRLQKTDLAMAELALLIPDIVSDAMGKLGTTYPNFAFTRHFMVQALVAVHTGRLNLRNAAEVWQDDDQNELARSWSKTESGVGRAVELVTGVVHWDSTLWMPSINALVPLIYILAHGKKLTVVQRKLARKWLLLAGVRRYFSGSGHGELDRILRKLQQEPTVERLWTVTKSNLQRLTADDFDVNHRSGPVMSLYVSMIRDREAKDWVKHTALNGTVLGHNAQLQVHHFFPRALLARHGIETGRINTFANYAIINKQTNLGISADEPAAYTTRMKIRRKELDEQCIPGDRSLWAVSRYDDFLAARRSIMAERANEYLG